MRRYARTRTIVYAIRTLEEALAAAEAGVDAVGFMFNPKSSRFVEPEEAWEIAAGLPPLVSTIGVYENASVEKFMEIEERCPTDYSQLHGNESEDVVRQCGTRAIKTVKFDSGRIAQDLQLWNDVDEVDAILVQLGPAADDPAALDMLGTASRAIAKPLLIAGGLNADNVGRVIEMLGPWAVGVSSGIEDSEGRKSEVRLREFLKTVRTTGV